MSMINWVMLYLEIACYWSEYVDLCEWGEEGGKENNHKSAFKDCW